MLGVLVTLLRKAVAQPLYRKFDRFELACQNTASVQEELLRRILAYHRDTAFGRDHRFDQIQTIADYRHQVGIAPYEYLEPYIRRVMKGETSALLADPRVLMFALTSGTTAARKHIPITDQYLQDYKRGWNLWGLQAIRKHTQVFLKPIVQMVGDADEYRTEANIPCGNLSGFTAQVQKRLMKRLYLVPSSTGKIKDPHARGYVALRAALSRRLGMLMAANPSTLVNIAHFMDREKESLIRDIADGTLNTQLNIPAEIRAILIQKSKPRPERARELEAFVNQSGALLPRDAWPAERLLIGCWTGGSVGPYLRQLHRFYGDAPIRDLGLLASEGRMTIPIADNTPSGVLDIATHYFEFIPEEEIDRPSPTVLGAHELREGGQYYILPTTKAGLYRYHISDLVRVTGFFHQAPLIEFVGKGNRFANLTGEKLSEYQVTRAVDQVASKLAQPLSAYSVAPCWDESQPHYAIFLEESDGRDAALLRRFVLELDIALGDYNIEYEAKRSSGRLGPLRAQLVSDGFWKQWDLARLQKTGGSPEQYKHPCLIGDPEFFKSLPRRTNAA
jgi:hypothetical protein